MQSCFSGTSRRDLLKAFVAWTITVPASSPVPAASSFIEKKITPKPAFASYVPGTARRLSQVTGDVDPTDLPHCNRTSTWGVTGTDMGCPVEFKGRLYLLFGDIPTTSPVDLDPICYTTDKSVTSGNLHLSCVTRTSGEFSAFRVDGKTLGTNETATGASSFNDKLYAFVVRGNSRPCSTLVSTTNPEVSTDFTAQYDISGPEGKFWQIAPCVVRNADVPGLPCMQGEGLLMWGQSGRAVYLAWMPLLPGLHPPRGMRFYGKDGLWLADQSMAIPIFATNGTTQISVTWLAGPRKWICLYTRASIKQPDESIVARIGENPWTWSDEIVIFNPDREEAWGKYLHKPGGDSLDSLEPPRAASLPGYAYSPFLLSRYTTWNAAKHHIALTYLMATFVPYQVMLMQATLQLSEAA